MRETFFFSNYLFSFSLINFPSVLFSACQEDCVDKRGHLLLLAAVSYDLVGPGATNTSRTHKLTHKERWRRLPGDVEESNWNASLSTSFSVTGAECLSLLFSFLAGDAGKKCCWREGQDAAATEGGNRKRGRLWGGETTAAGFLFLRPSIDNYTRLSLRNTCCTCMHTCTSYERRESICLSLLGSSSSLLPRKEILSRVKEEERQVQR